VQNKKKTNIPACYNKEKWSRKQHYSEDHIKKRNSTLKKA
jgi:hypothetical protein